MAIDLGVLQLDDSVVLRQLRQDLKDDWFPDPRGFDDLFKHGQVQNVVNENFKANAGVYKPLKPDIMNVPKSNFTLRYALETGIADRALYHGLVAYLIPFYDPLLPWNVFSHRRSDERNSRRYLFNSAIESWRNFQGTVTRKVKTSPALLSTDLTNYYENIDLGLLRRVMTDLLTAVNATAAEKGQIRACLQTLFDCLSSWCYTPEGGLPQNRDASSFLANIYMLRVDEFMLGKGYQYFRYMDDIKIACRDVHQARRALKDLTLALRQWGLSVNSGKTRICAPGDEQAIAECLDTGGGELQQIAAIWNTRSLRPISRSFPHLKALTIRLLREGGVDRRAFRFCVHRLEALAYCPEFDVPPEYFEEITPLIIHALTTNPSASDRLTQYLRAVPLNPTNFDYISALLRDRDRNIYTWQSHSLWTLLINKRHVSDLLLKHAMELVRTGPDDANRAGAVMYAGALGGKAERLVIAQCFSRAVSFHGQRASLLAVQELEYRHIREHVQDHIRSDLQGVYKGIRGEGVYMVEPERQPITRFIDLDRHYD